MFHSLCIITIIVYFISIKKYYSWIQCSSINILFWHKYFYFANVGSQCTGREREDKYSNCQSRSSRNQRDKNFARTTYNKQSSSAGIDHKVGEGK